MAEEKGLTGKLNVSYGDLIQLSNSQENVEVTGYVYIYKNSNWIRLSVENPLKNSFFEEKVRRKYCIDYGLEEFTEYKVLQRANE